VPAQHCLVIPVLVTGIQDFNEERP
jgi:hypothetical protein